MESPQHPTTTSPSSPPISPPTEHPPLPFPMPPPPTHPQTQPPPSSSSPSAVTASRRLPPPCWSHEETVALIDSYREMWYTLRRGNLRALHWEEVADAVARRCPMAIPPKTSVQCRHKMEKLRKRYRTEVQRSLSIPNHRFSSSWIYFKKMDAMEKGPNSSAATAVLPVAVDSDDDIPENTNENVDNDDDDNDCDENGHNGDNASYMFQNYDSRKSYNTRDLHGGMMSNGGGSRIRIQGSPSSGSGFGSKIYRKFDENPGPGLNSYKAKYNYSTPSSDAGVKYSTRALKNGSGSGAKAGSRKRAREGDEVMEMVAAINVLGEGFVKMEKMKMDMMREIERMRMEMELKRTEMILESQQRIVEAFAKGISDRKKKAKGMPLPES